MISLPKKPEKELSWFPCYPDRILSSTHWMKMQDFQRGWYWQILLLMTRSKPLGYLRLDDGQIGGLAGARTRQYWEANSGLVLACFQTCEFDGHKWIYNQKLLDVLTEQEVKHAKAVESGKLAVKGKGALSRASISSSPSDCVHAFKRIWEEYSWSKVSRKTAEKAFQKAVAFLESEKKMSLDDSIAFISGAMEEFGLSDAGKENGLFAEYQPPYPASWLNGQRYLDDRKAWYRTHENPNSHDQIILARAWRSAAARTSSGAGADPLAVSQDGRTGIPRLGGDSGRLSNSQDPGGAGPPDETTSGS